VSTFATSREIPAMVEQVFAAISNPQRLARWWGPDGFTNTFNVYEFRSEGRWSLIMHRPDGTNYPNENLFATIEPFKKVIVQHIFEPKFRLTITLDPSALGTLVSWSQVFENVDVARQIAHIIIPSNEQNLDRLKVEISRGAGSV
jgi:uncharacterized protein YndB with AHSA1/START domain